MKKFITAVFLMVSTVCGVSLLGFPYIFSKIGILTGFITLIIVGSAATLMSLYIAELSLNEKKEHLLSGFAKKYFGRRGKYFTLIIETLGLYTAIIAYLIAVGTALGELFNVSPLIMGTIFFVIVAFLILFKFERFTKLDLSIAFIKFLILFFIIFTFFPSEYKLSLDISKVFMPFGIVLFACLGYNVIPEMKKLLKGKKLIRAILVSMITIIFIYLIFSYVFSGRTTNEIAFIGLPKFSLIGNLYILIAISIPFIALADAVKHIYVKDIGLDRRVSWFLSVFIPFIIYLYTKFGFILFLQISGTYTGGLLGILTSLLVLKRRKMKRYKILIPGGNIPIYFSIVVFLLGITYQTYLFLVG